jgi:sterol desaturase/sphingolipid hydroxylase (fatty acid hydroxylase superfamily)
MPTPFVVIGLFVVLLIVFKSLELLNPRERRIKILRRGFWTDATYWVFNPYASNLITRIAVVITIAPIVLLAYGKLDFERLQHGFGPIGRWPLAMQAVLMLTIADFIQYWMHRAFHGRRLWLFHAVHHSSEQLDWLAAARVHPLNDMIMRLSAAIPLIALGFAPAAVVAIAPVLTLFAIMLHANLDWDFGPLRSFIVSPRFHRWHHTDESAARDKNFSGLFPIWDILFGTYYMPRDRVPETFGTSTPVPQGLLRQLLFPFRRQP